MPRIALLILIILTGCSPYSVKHYTDFLYANMSFADSICTTRNYWEANAQAAMEARKAAGWKVPEKEFLHYVLPVRVNNEPLDDFRTTYGPELLARVKGLDATAAALEVNHWCHEHATYIPSDGRTCSPMQTILHKQGRCGEESVLAVAALRAVGIPARQVYTPRWAHTDDNHAWVEVFVDGKWWFMGACEPAPTLNNAWFNAPVSRVMLLHTRAFGQYEGDEDIISRAADHTEINVTGSYVDAGRTEVQVLDLDGNPVQGATVEFKIYNYAELYTVARQESGADGIALLTTGFGDIIIWAYKDGCYGIAKVHGGEPGGRVVLDRRFGEPASLDFHIIPPPEKPIPTNASAEEIAANGLRLAQEDSIRAARPQSLATDAFRAAHSGDPRVEPLLSILSAKDREDVPLAVLEDALAHCGETFNPLLDCPRVELENLLPFFGEIRQGLDAEGLHFCCTQEVREWVDANVRVSENGNPRHLRIPPVYVWRSRMADPLSKDIFYVALCRAAGFEAEYDQVHGQVAESGRENAGIQLDYRALPWLDKPLYYRHFTLSRIDNGSARLIALDEGRNWAPADISGLGFEPGDYLLTSGVRMADGSVQAHLEFFHLDTSAEVPLVLRDASGDEVPVIGQVEISNELLARVGRGNFLLAVLGERDEPSSHARHELSAAADVLSAWGRPTLVVSAGDPVIPKEFQYSRLPLIAVCDSFGRVFYLSRGYNTSLATDLESLLPRL